MLAISEYASSASSGLSCTVHVPLGLTLVLPHPGSPCSGNSVSTISSTLPPTLRWSLTNRYRAIVSYILHPLLQQQQPQAVFSILQMNPTRKGFENEDRRWSKIEPSGWSILSWSLSINTSPDRYWAREASFSTAVGLVVRNQPLTQQWFLLSNPGSVAGRRTRSMTSVSIQIQAP